MNHHSHSTCENMFYYMIKKKQRKIRVIELGFTWQLTQYLANLESKSA